MEKVAEWLGKPEQPVLIVWDGATWHRVNRVCDWAEVLGFQLMPLSGYSPNLNSIEGLWKWMQEEVTQHHSYSTVREHFQACKEFVDRINLDPDVLAKSLCPKLSNFKFGISGVVPEGIKLDYCPIRVDSGLKPFLSTIGMR